MATIGLLVGRENTFPQPFIDAINARGIPGISAEFVKLGGTALDEELPYRVIVDRISHEVPYYRCYLKSAVLRGTIVVNDPFWWTADDKFLECHIARRVGVAVPKTLLLPNKEYIEGITSESLRNLRAPLDWEAMLAYVGRPAFLKPAMGGGWKHVYKVHDVDELIRCYDQTGQQQMILQEAIEFQQYVRCICIGRTHVRVARYEPGAPFHERYQSIEGYLSPELHERIVNDALALCRALGYDMNTVEFAIRDGVPYAIDFLNPAPDFDNFSIGEDNFRWVLEKMTDLVIAYAQGEAEPARGYIWQEYPFRVVPPPPPLAAGTLPSTRPAPAPATPVPDGEATEETAAMAALDAPATKSRSRSRKKAEAVEAAEQEGLAVEAATTRPRRSRKKAE